MERAGIRRRRLLHACGVSALTIAHKAYKRVEEVQGPIGYVSQRMASLAGPIVNQMESQWLAFLSFADDRILAAESMVETLFPSSAYVFDMIDSFVHIPEALPGKFDHVVDILSVIIRRMPFLRWSLTLFLWELNFLFLVFNDCRLDEAAKEKEIMVDINCNPSEQDPMETTNHAHDNEDHFAPKSVSIHKSPHPPPPGEHENKAMYKKALIGKSPPPAPVVGEPLNAAKEKEIMVDINCNEFARASGIPPERTMPHAAKSPPASPPTAIYKKASMDQAPPAAARVGEHENKSIFKKVLMGKSPHPTPVGEPKTLQTKAERKTTGTETEKASVLAGETVKQVKRTSYKEVFEMGNKADTEMKEGNVDKKKHQKPMVNVSMGKKEKSTGADLGTEGTNELNPKDFPILELFDAGWHMKSKVRGG